MKNYIEQTANEIIEKYNSRDPFEILRVLGVNIEFNGNLESLKGFYTVINGCKYVVINSNLSLPEQRSVAAHELGHCCLHQHFAESQDFRESMIYDMESKPEYEANMFAGYLLVSDEDIKEAAAIGYSLSQMAAYLNIDEKILALRVK